MSSNGLGFVTADDICAFLERHGTKYDAEADAYDRPVFIADIKEGKNDPIYLAHSYHTKVPPRAIIPYILHYTEPGDIVFDPFCGSGMTGVAALMCDDLAPDLREQYPQLVDRLGARQAVLADLSPAACHIANNYCTPVSVSALKREFARVITSMKEEYDWLYGTEHYEPAEGFYAISKPEVAARICNISDAQLPAMARTLRDALGEPTWKLIDRHEVEERLGYDVGRLDFSHRSDLVHAGTHQSNPKDIAELGFDAGQCNSWIVIPATLQYTIWSDVYRCQGTVAIEEPTGKLSTRGRNVGKPIVRKKRVPRGCGKDFALWHVAVDEVGGAIADVFTCPFCKQKWRKTDLRRQGIEAIIGAYDFTGFTKSVRGVAIKQQRLRRPVTLLERARLAEIDAKPIPYWYPDDELDKTWPQYRRDALSAKRVFKVSDFYTRRNLWALGRLRKEIMQSPEELRSAMLFALTGVAITGSRLNAHHFGGQARPRIGTLFVPSFAEEANVMRLLKGKEKSQPKFFSSLGRLIHHACRVVACSSASKLTLPEASVDYVYTDPPFGSNIYYSDLNILWEAWLGAYTERQHEAVTHRPNDGGDKRLDHYERVMQLAFRNIFHCLKPGRFMTMVFNNSDGRVNEAIKRSVLNAGFVIENMSFLDKVQRTFKQIIGERGEEDVVGTDVVFNLRKPSVRATPTSSRPEVDLMRLVAVTISEHLRSLPAHITADPATYSEEHRTSAFLNTMLMKTLIPRGVDVSQLNLPFIEQVCTRYFRKIDGKWYLRNEALGVENGGNQLLDQEVEIESEVSAVTWLRQHLERRPMMIGEIKPLWFKATAKLRGGITLELDRLLRQNFWHDQATNRYSEPTTEQRAMMDTTEREMARHDAERFLSGGLNRSVSDEEVCCWIGHLYESASEVPDGGLSGGDNGIAQVLPDDVRTLYEQMGRLFQGVLKERVDGKLYALTSRQVRIATSKLKLSEEVRSEAESVGRKNDNQKRLFE